VHNGKALVQWEDGGVLKPSNYPASAADVDQALGRAGGRPVPLQSSRGPYGSTPARGTTRRPGGGRTFARSVGSSISGHGAS
jgi:hypothetical protein